MIEYERKFRIDNSQKQKILSKLPALKTTSILSQIDTVFLYDKSSFDTFTPGEAVIRTRAEGSKVKLTYKRSINEMGDSIEHEVGVESEATIHAILRDMGYQEVVRVEKNRQEVEENGITVTLDYVKNLGDFVEIEIVADNDEDAENRIMARANELGLSEDDIETKKYDRLLMANQV